ncbi:MAG: hypothetical protein EOL95_09340 [Bacteroidia bacterium]|nr:hypothetical protein [Bacteroidia bacterium]
MGEYLKEQYNKRNIQTEASLYYYKTTDKSFLEKAREYQNKINKEIDSKLELAKSLGGEGLAHTRDRFLGVGFPNKQKVKGFTKRKTDGVTYFVPKDKELKAKLHTDKKYTSVKKTEEILGTSKHGGAFVLYRGDTIAIQSIVPISKKEYTLISKEEFEEIYKKQPPQPIGVDCEGLVEQSKEEA